MNRKKKRRMKIKEKWKKGNEQRNRNTTAFKEETSTDGDSILDSSEDKEDDWKIKDRKDITEKLRRDLGAYQYIGNVKK